MVSLEKKGFFHRYNLKKGKSVKSRLIQYTDATKYSRYYMYYRLRVHVYGNGVSIPYTYIKNSMFPRSYPLIQ